MPRDKTRRWAEQNCKVKNKSCLLLLLFFFLFVCFALDKAATDICVRTPLGKNIWIISSNQTMQVHGRKQVRARNNIKLKMRLPVTERHSSRNAGCEVGLSLFQKVRTNT